MSWILFVSCYCCSQFNPLLLYGLSHPYHLDVSILIFRDIRSIFHYHFSMKFVQANKIAQMFRGVTSRDILGRQPNMGFKINVLTIK